MRNMRAYCAYPPPQRLSLSIFGRGINSPNNLLQ
jgi:hypothetical protein